MVILDSSVLINLFKGKITPAVSKLITLEQGEEELGIPAVCLQEVLQGARDRKEWSQLFEYLSSQTILLPMDGTATHVDAARIYFDARKKGFTPRSSVDCLIAQLAIERKRPLLHDDKDFQIIRKVRPELKLL